MVGEIKALQFTDGQEVTPPTAASNYFAKNNFSATSNPLTTSDTTAGYAVGSKWVNVSTDDAYICVDSTATAAIWDIITPSAISLAVSSKTDDYTTTNADDLILIDAISDDITITLNTAVGNTGQQLVIKRIDDTTIQTDTFVDGDVTVGTDNINVASHPLTDLQRVQLTTSGVLPSGLALATDYYVIYVDANNIKLASSKANAVADTAVDIVSAAGGGTHTITSEENIVTIDGNASETIDGDLTVLFTTQDCSIKIISDGTNWEITKEIKHLTGYLKDVKAVNTDGGTFTSGDWRTRDLNTSSGDFTKFGTLDSSNQFTLNAGTYDIESTVPAYSVTNHVAKLRNISDSTDDIIGSSSTMATTTTGYSHIKDTITITSTKTFEVQDRCAVTKSTNGFGALVNLVVDEVYTQVKITKIK